MTKQYRVVQDYAGRYDEPISFETGEAITREYADAQFPGWWWCTDKREKSGWVHESFFDEDDYRYIANRDYSAVELTVKAGEVLSGLEAVGGWLLAQTATDVQGWVPLANVELLPDGV